MNTQFNSDAWYKEGLQFECTQCGGCCSGGPGFVWIDDNELQAMANHLKIEVEDFKRKFTRMVDGRRSLTERQNYDCVLLDQESRKCTVYENRPIQCRTWPFWDSCVQSKKAWQATCRVCPGAGTGRLYSLDQIEIQRTEKIV
ncbi:MAG: YkgJ family cysteine cluster protein [Planctomycetota bacterium]